MAVNALQAFCVNCAQPQCVNMSTNNYLTIQNQTKWITSRKPAPLPFCRSNRNNRRTLSQEPRQMATGKYSGKPFTLQDQFELPSLPHQECIPACGHWPLPLLADSSTLINHFFKKIQMNGE